jgi:type II secretory pathway pseudopilin PulG
MRLAENRILVRLRAGSRSRTDARSCPSGRGGFTLPEASLAVLIVGIGFLAVMELFSACTLENQRSSQVTTAQLLATNIQELMANLAFKDPHYSTTTWGAEAGESLMSYNDIDDFDGLSFNPPLDSTRAAIPQLARYTQVVTVMPVDPNRPGNNTDTVKPEIGKGTYTGAVRVRVAVLYRANAKDLPVEVLRSAWVRLDN